MTKKDKIQKLILEISDLNGYAGYILYSEMPKLLKELEDLKPSKKLINDLTGYESLEEFKDDMVNV